MAEQYTIGVQVHMGEAEQKHATPARNLLGAKQAASRGWYIGPTGFLRVYSANGALLAARGFSGPWFAPQSKEA